MGFWQSFYLGWMLFLAIVALVKHGKNVRVDATFHIMSRIIQLFVLYLGGFFGKPF